MEKPLLAGIKRDFVTHSSSLVGTCRIELWHFCVMDRWCHMQNCMLFWGEKWWFYSTILNTSSIHKGRYKVICTFSKYWRMFKWCMKQNHVSHVLITAPSIKLTGWGQGLLARVSLNSVLFHVNDLDKHSHRCVPDLDGSLKYCLSCDQNGWQMDCGPKMNVFLLKHHLTKMLFLYSLFDYCIN